MSVLRQPLLQFLVIGALLYGLYLTIGDGRDGGADATTIHITSGTIDALSEDWIRTWNRPPTEDELVGMVEAYVEEEVLYREALALGLDKDDTIVRRRLRQKIDFLADDLITVAPPDEAALRTYLAANAERYSDPPRLTLTQVFIDPARHGDDLDDVVATTAAQLAEGADPTQTGDPFLLPMTYRDVSLDKLARDLGEHFATAVAGLPVGVWNGPVASAYGLHLVRVDALQAGSLPEFAAVRDAVERDWYAEQRARARDAYVQELAGRYDIQIEWPDGVSPPIEVTAWQP